MQLTYATRERDVKSETVRDLARRIEAEYAEMPGLSVTLPQAQRLWAADRHTCQTVFDRLIARSVLRMTTKGRFVRAWA
jgi:agmatine/peptidylarginine deiminase